MWPDTINPPCLCVC